ncbi:MAG: hypothetical protein J1E85_09140 [Ruminococcus sp.]|nr:hypothetical protein [Ruminococcus sp.]
MKKLTKRMSVIALCIVMLVMAVVPAFAAESASENPLVASDYTGPIEDHSIIDCTNRYRMDDGKYNFTIKLPQGTNLYDVTLEITRNDEGSRLFYDRLFYFSVPGVFGTSVTLSYSYDGSDYYEFICHQFSTEGVGIKLFMTYDGVSYMATDAPNGSTTQGRGYWLSA